jgi:hypothetical protein
MHQPRDAAVSEGLPVCFGHGSVIALALTAMGRLPKVLPAIE